MWKQILCLEHWSYHSKIVDPQIYFIDDTLYVMAGADETDFLIKYMH